MHQLHFQLRRLRKRSGQFLIEQFTRAGIVLCQCPRPGEIEFERGIAGLQFQQTGEGFGRKFRLPAAHGGDCPLVAVCIGEFTQIPQPRVYVPGAGGLPCLQRCIGNIAQQRGIIRIMLKIAEQSFQPFIGIALHHGSTLTTSKE